MISFARFSLVLFFLSGLAGSVSLEAKPSYPQRGHGGVYHYYQFGIDVGAGDISAPGTNFPFGSSLDAFFRFDHHTLGFRGDHYSDLGIFSTPTYYQFLNVFYGYSFEQKYTSISPQFGFGQYETNRFHRSKYRSVGAEASVDVTLHIRGNGIGVRGFYQINSQTNYVGFALHLTIGLAWESDE